MDYRRNKPLSALTPGSPNFRITSDACTPTEPAEPIVISLSAKNYEFILKIVQKIEKKRYNSESNLRDYHQSSPSQYISIPVHFNASILPLFYNIFPTNIE